MSNALKTLAVIIGALAALFVIQALAFGNYRLWAPKYEEARREVFEQTPSFVHGKREFLARLYGQWLSADEAHRGALCATARMEASTLDPQHVPSSLRAWECIR